MEIHICENCEEEVDELFETEDSSMLCSECLENQGYMLCDGCGNWSLNYEEAPSGSVYCGACLAGGIMLEDYVGDCRFLMDTVNFETLHLDEDLEEELKNELKNLALRALVDGDEDARETMKSLTGLDYKKSSPNVSLDDQVDTFIESCLEDTLIVEAFEALGFNVIHETACSGAHGHGSYGAIYIK